VRIALIGTRGVPARYGGFETCVEEVGRRLAAKGHRITVYCRAAAGDPRPVSHLGMRLVHLPAVRHKALETLSHTALSVRHARRERPDVAFVFNAGNAPLLPVLKSAGIPVATHVDGLEWKRDKWRGIGAVYYRRAESLSVRWSDSLIADSRGIQDYYLDRFGIETEYIPYGAPILPECEFDRLPALGLEPGEYHLVVARFEPENNVHLAVDGYLRSSAEYPLVVVGSAPYADAYRARIEAVAAGSPRVHFVGSLWDQQQLDQLYAGALTYIHGHSVGGTNPSLLRAMGAGAATSAYDVSFNREVLGSYGRYFGTAAELAALCDAAEADPGGTAVRGRKQIDSLDRYNWDAVADSYHELALRLAGLPVSSNTPAEQLEHENWSSR
jgi:glycosyltransferase involved in cell wall biosynthesis